MQLNKCGQKVHEQICGKVQPLVCKKRSILSDKLSHRRKFYSVAFSPTGNGIKEKKRTGRLLVIINKQPVLEQEIRKV